MTHYDLVVNDGLVVAPGFVDLHTHYDAQVFWNPYLPTSGWQVVTSVVTGNCGYGGDTEFVRDLPAGQMRAIVRAQGYRWVLVNGEVIIDDNKETGAMAGRLLRHGSGAPT